ncbi:MAG: hypothetical protein COY74_05600 [Nitrosopumilales archaeon CG_4_10_14_0_8_um_filter_34_8]|nr:MAG: hypothetical protein COY74_05600 [Nitrosopumilales archaeon CG_4_10_14_0_8_um_filter_34_8]
MKNIIYLSKIYINFEKGRSSHKILRIFLICECVDRHTGICMVKKKRGSGIERQELSELVSKTIDKNKTVFEVLDEH